MPQATIEVELGDLNAKIDQLLVKKKTRPLMENVGRIMVTDAQLNFKAQKDPAGNPWKPTIRGGSILRDTGRLRNSIQYDLDSDVQVRVGTNVIYAPVHQFGAVIKAKNAPYLKFMVGGKFIQKKKVTIPARPFIGFAKRQIDKINGAIEAWADKLLG